MLFDIWQFYRAERLYLLRVLKEILSHSRNSTHKHHEIFANFFTKLKEKDLKGCIIKQICSSIGCKYEQSNKDASHRGNISSEPEKGSGILHLHFRDELRKAYVHFTLREQVELLQLLLLYLNVADSETERSYDLKDVKLLLKIFQQHAFGRKQKFIGNSPGGINPVTDVIAPELTEAVGQLESLIILYLFDLPSLTVYEDKLPQNKVNCLWDSKISGDRMSSSSIKDDLLDGVRSIDAVVSSLGNIAEHAPVMLGWMLSHYLVEGEESLAIHRSLGERAVQLNVVKFLLNSIQNETAVGLQGSVVATLTYGTIYSVLSVLTTAFNPEQMGLKDDYHNLVCNLLKNELIAKYFWEQGFESGLGMYFAACLSKFPAIRKESMELSCALASAGPESAKQVHIMLSERLTVFAEPVESVPGHQLQLLSSGTERNYESHRWQLIVEARYPSGRISGVENATVVIPKGTKATSDGRFYQWHLGSYDGLQYLFRDVDVAVVTISTGIKNLSANKLEELQTFTKLMENMLRNRVKKNELLGAQSVDSFERLAAHASFVLIEKFSQVQHPPINLLANCVKSLSLIAQRTHRPQTVWEKLGETGIFPYLTRSHSLMTFDSSLKGNKSINDFNTIKTADINHGLIGSVLAQQECVQGLYPLTMSFLDLLLACTKSDDRSVKSDDVAHQEIQYSHPTVASILYTIHDIFPSFQQWGFSIPGDREKFGQKILLICLEIIEISKKDSGHTTTTLNKSLKDAVIDAIMAAAPNQTLLGIAGTGDKVIQSLYESQANAEAGVGCELSKLVNLSLKVLDSIIKIHASKKESNSNLGIEKIIGGTPVGAKPHFLLTVANYIHHLQSCDLPRSAVNLLSTIASVFPMSMLACFGNEAQAIRDILLRRLESKTEDILLKIAIVKFFTSCVESQPGLIQLLLGVKDVNIININAYIKNPEQKQQLTSSEEKSNDVINLLEDNGCLKTILGTLSAMKNGTETTSTLANLLHVVVVDFLYNLWSHQRILAVSHLKRQDTFWSDLTSPLFDKTSQVVFKPRLNGCILRIIASEIYTYRGDIDKPLKAILEKFFDEKKNYLDEWCTLVINRLLEDREPEGNLSITDDSLSISSKSTVEEDAIFLLGSWKTFLVVLSRDQPIVVRPKQCYLIIDCLVTSIQHHLKFTISDCDSESSSRLRIITSLAETSLILMRRWQTKCADNMERFCVQQGKLLGEVSRCQSALHPRFVSAVIAAAATALKFSQFKFKDGGSLDSASNISSGPKSCDGPFSMDAQSRTEEKVLLTWLPPVVKMVQNTINNIIDGLLSGGRINPKEQKLSIHHQEESNQHIEILAIGLLRNLVIRLNASSEAVATENIPSKHSRNSLWFFAFHETALVQTILSGAHHYIRFRQRPDFIHGSLTLLLTLSRTVVGCNAILSSDLSQLLWLPLSSIKQGASKEWIPVFVESLHLVATLLRVGKQQALNNAISFVALLQDQLISFLSSKGGTTAADYTIGVEFFMREDQVRLTSSTASLISLMMAYYKQWQLQHPSSLNQTYQSMCVLLHTSVCLLIRPSVLKMLIEQNNKDKDRCDLSNAGLSMGHVATEIHNARRRLSSKGATTSEDTYLSFDEEGSSGEACSIVGNIQNRLLDIVGSCLKMLSLLSPDLVALLTDDLIDHASYIELLQMGFSSPTFEQENNGALTYGTIVSISNLCIKNLARTSQQTRERSPSSTKSESSSSPEGMIYKGMIIGLCRNLLLVAIQN